MVLVGVHPSFTHVPPTCARSTSAVRMPATASVCDRGTPAGPAPITIASYLATSIEPSLDQKAAPTRAGCFTVRRPPFACQEMPLRERTATQHLPRRNGGSV